MSFSKYLSLLVKRTLFFTRVDRLEDKYEAKYPKHIFAPAYEAQLSVRSE